MLARFILIEGDEGGGRCMGVEDADLISDLLDLQGRGLEGLDDLPETAMLSSLRRLIQENDGGSPAFYGFQNMMVAGRMEDPEAS
jgi:hypothetical protein